MQLNKIGKWDISVLETGTFRLDGGAMMGSVPKVLWEKTNPADSYNRISLAMRCILLDDGKNRVLIESGIDKNDEIQLNGFGLSTPAERLVTIDYGILRDGCKGNPEAVNNYFKDIEQMSIFDLDDRASDPTRRPGFAGVFTSKGCVARCTFCQRSTKGFRVMPLKILEEHVTHLRDDHNVGFISILGFLFLKRRHIHTS